MPVDCCGGAQFGVQPPPPPGLLGPPPRPREPPCAVPVDVLGAFVPARGGLCVVPCDGLTEEPYVGLTAAAGGRFTVEPTGRRPAPGAVACPRADTGNRRVAAISDASAIFMSSLRREKPYTSITLRYRELNVPFLPVVTLAGGLFCMPVSLYRQLCQYIRLTLR